MSKPASLKDLAGRIAVNAETLQRKLEVQGLPPPTLHDITPTDLDRVDQDAARELAVACRQLQLIAQGPTRSLHMHAFAGHDVSSVGFLTWFDLPKLVPLDKPISFTQLAAQVDVLEDKLVRILRYSFTNAIFRESPPGHVSHTTLSAYLHKNPAYVELMKLLLVDMMPIFAKLAIAQKKYGQSESPKETATNVAFDWPEDFFGWLVQDMGRLGRFTTGMIGYSKVDRPQEVDEKGYPWEKLKSDAVIVDVGGGAGHISKALATAYPKHQYIVQDLEGVIADARAALEPEWKEGRLRNVSVLTYDFFDPQPVQGADVYFFRHIFHAFPNSRAIGVLHALQPALRKGSRVLISEYFVPTHDPDNVGFIEEKMLRQLDMNMLCVHHGRERSVKDFVALLEAAVPKLKFVAIHQLPGYTKGGVIEAIYDP